MAIKKVQWNNLHSTDYLYVYDHEGNIQRVVYTCKKCGELNYLTPHAFWNIAGFGIKFEKCETINTITLEEGGLKK
jgi:hypothetical protein